MLLALGTPARPIQAAETTANLSGAEFQAQIGAAQQLAAACASRAEACDPVALPGDERVAANGSQPAFNAGWDWFRQAVIAAKTAKTAERAQSMKAAGDHLHELAAEAAGSGVQRAPVAFERTRKAANEILSHDEFQTAAAPSWLDRQFARLQDWFFRLFLSMGQFGEHRPWIAPLIEWTCFLLAAGGLLFFVRRSLARQALRIALGEGAAVARRTDRDSTDWTTLAAEHSGRGEWRDAVHCLYWAAILSLETRRTWRPNPTRTPREYLRLLRPGSEAQAALRELTRIFERVWYGSSEAVQADFAAAEGAFRLVQTADVSRPLPAAGAALPAGGSA